MALPRGEVVHLLPHVEEVPGSWPLGSAPSPTPGPYQAHHTLVHQLEVIPSVSQAPGVWSQAYQGLHCR